MAFIWNTKCSLILTIWLFLVYYFLKLPFPICQLHFAKMLDSQFHIPKFTLEKSINSCWIWQGVSIFTPNPKESGPQVHLYCPDFLEIQGEPLKLVQNSFFREACEVWVEWGCGWFFSPSKWVSCWGVGSFFFNFLPLLSPWWASLRGRGLDLFFPNVVGFWAWIWGREGS